MLVTAVVTTQVYCHCVAAISASHTRPVCIMPNNLFAVRHFIVDSRMLTLFTRVITVCTAGYFCPGHSVYIMFDNSVLWFGKCWSVVDGLCNLLLLLTAGSQAPCGHRVCKNRPAPSWPDVVKGD